MENTPQLESSLLVLIDAFTGLLVGTGLITLDVKTTVMSQLPSIINDVIAIIPLSYGIWHGVKFIALSIKKQFSKVSTGPVAVAQTPTL